MVYTISYVHFGVLFNICYQLKLLPSWMWINSNFSRVCSSVCLFLQTLAFELLEPKTLPSLCRQSFTISGPSLRSLRTKVTGSMSWENLIYIIYSYMLVFHRSLTQELRLSKDQGYLMPWPYQDQVAKGVCMPLTKKHCTINFKEDLLPTESFSPTLCYLEIHL